MSIKTLSPHYVDIPLINPVTGVICSSYTLNIFIWVGSKAASPSTPAYSITKINAAGLSGTEKINISRIANDFIEFDCEPEQDTVIVDGNNQAWVRYECFYDDMPAFPGVIGIELATKGYGYFLEGTNPQLPDNKILLTGDEFKVSRGGMFVLPFMVDEPPVEERFLGIDSFVKSTSVKYLITVTANFSYPVLYVFVRPVGATDWVPLVKSGASYIVPADIAANVFEVMAAAYDAISGLMIYSSEYVITALKIDKIEPSSAGMAIVVYFTSNLAVDDYLLQIYGLSGATWSNTTIGATSPLFFSFTPTGSFKARIKVGDNYSNEVSFVIPLLSPIIIP